MRATLIATLLLGGCQFDGGVPAHDLDAGPPAFACPPEHDPAPGGAPFAPAAEPSTPVTASFQLTIDPTHPDFASGQREPQSGPLAIERLAGGLELRGGVKRFAKHEDRLYLELYLLNDASVGARALTATVAGAQNAAAFHDLSVDPWAPPSASPTVVVGGIAPEGVARLRLGFELQDAGQPLAFRLELAGLATSRVAASSSPIAISPDGAEVWTAVLDADVLAVVETASDTRVASVPAAGRPSSVAITPDGALVLVVCATCNQLIVIDRAARVPVQILGEAAGLGREPRHVVISPDGARAYVSSYVGDSVTTLERTATDRFRVLATTPVGRRPTGLSVTPDGATVFVAHFLPRGPIEDNEGWISILDGATGALVGEAALRDDANVAEAECLSQVAAFGDYSGAQLSFEASPTQLAGVFLNPSGNVGWVPGLRVAGFPIFEGDPTPLGFQFLAVGANSPSMLFPLDTRAPRSAGFRRVPAVIDITDRDEAFLRCVPATEDAEAVRVRAGAVADETIYPGVTIPSQSTLLDETGVVRFVGYGRGGRRVLLLSYVADELAVLDGVTHSPVSRRHLQLSGSQPIGIAVTPDGAKAYVAYENSLYASVLALGGEALPAPVLVPYRLDPGAAAGQGATIITFLMLTRGVAGVPDRPAITEVAQVPLVDADPLDPLERRGKVLFSSSNPDKYPTLSASRQAACASCHPDGGADGSAWSTMEGERRTIGLWGGTAGRGWLHASATHRSIVDFATLIVKERLGGSGLSPEDEHALESYAAYGIPALQPPRVDAARAARGAQLFALHCVSCHDGPDGGGSGWDPEDPFGGGRASGPRLVDVGSAVDWAHVTLGTAYTHLFPPVARRVLDALAGDRDLGPEDDVQQTLAFSPRPARARGALKPPALVNTWQNAVFFHDARFTSLEQVVDYFDDRLALGLSEPDRAALVEYLKTL